MSVHEPPQFTPGQVLEAARRAEAEGRGELAQTFYRHLAEHYPGTPEAAAAQAGLARTGSGLPAQQTGPTITGSQLNGQRPALSARPAAAPELPHLEAPQQAPPAALPAPFAQPALALANPFEAPRPPEPTFTQWQQPYATQPAPAPTMAPSAVQQAETTQAHYAEAVELPRLRGGYRTGRFIAALGTWLGGLQLLLGLVIMPLALVNPGGLARIPLLGALIAGPGTGAWMIIFGLMQMMVGQLARALFDMAMATRDIAEITRAEAEARYGSPPERRRRR